MSLANPVNLLFFVLLVVAGFALLNEQIILVGIISTLALLMVAVAAGVLAIFFVGSNKTLSSRGFTIFLGLALVVPVAIWSFEIFNTIPHNQWFYVAELVAIMLVCSLYLVPRLRDIYRSKCVMA
ncbi:MAG: hypothetical protein GY927_21735 [bacterium]|nr:hypothetical protein [bacterium]